MINSYKFDNSQNEENTLNPNNLNKKSFLNIDINYLKQDILYFKNDVLKDIRKFEEKVNIKLGEHKFKNSEKFEFYNKKLEDLSNKISHINQYISDNKSLIDKISFLEKFKVKTEDNIYALNSKISTIQKESRDSYCKYERLVNENLLFHGAIGNNEKFPNMKFFIDFVLNNIKSLNEFKEEIRNINFNEYKKKINSEIHDLKYHININSKDVIGHSLKETNSLLKDFSCKYDKKFDDNNQKFELYEKKINEYLNEYQTKLFLLEKDLNNKYIEQIKEMENIKTMQKHYNNINEEIKKDIKDINNEKSKIDKNNSYNCSYNNYVQSNLYNRPYNNKNHRNKIIENNDIFYNKLIYNRKKKEKSSFFDSINYQSDDNEKIKENYKIKKYIENGNTFLDNRQEKILNKTNINEINYILENFDKNNFIKLTFSKVPLYSNSKLFKKVANNSYKNINIEDISNKTNCDNTTFKLLKYGMEFSPENEYKSNKELEYKNKIKNNNNNKLTELPTKKIFPNNYSITNIPNIEFKKIFIPEPLNISNHNDCLSKNHFRTIKSCPSNHKKSLLNEININNINYKSIFTQIANNKIKNIKHFETPNIKNKKKTNINQKENSSNSLKIVNIKNNNNKTMKNKSSSYSKYKTGNNTNIFSTFGKKLNKKYKLKE